MSKVSLNLSHSTYDILIQEGISQQVAFHLKRLDFHTKNVAIITDETVGTLYLNQFLKSLEKDHITCSHHIVPSGEASKSMPLVEQLCRQMVQAGHDRHSLVIALGGGVVGDLAGFVASIFFRGIPFIQLPTTIVSQVDSSVGGKTGVNTPEGKNLIGAFHQPCLVLVDPLLLKTLPAREYQEGFAEIIKHACIRDASMISDLETLDPLSIPPPSSLLSQNIAIKARIVEEDELETSGTRALLNFGHTIGHGIEASIPYGTLLHGEAISLGIRAALTLSERHSTLSKSEANRVIKLLQHFQLPVILPDHITTNAVLEKLKTDKKFSAGQIKFVLLKSLGEAYVSAELSMDDLRMAIEDLRLPI